MKLTPRVIGAPLDRVDGPQKVTGGARYAYEYPVADVLYASSVQSTIARGLITGIDASAARALPGVVQVLSHQNAPRLAWLDDAELAVLQSPAVAYHGQIVAVVVAETPEIARWAAGLLVVRYEEQSHDVVLRGDRGDLYKPVQVNAGNATDTASGDVEAAMASAAVSVDQTYTTPTYHNNPLEPHATIAIWSDDGERLTLYDANQGAYGISDTVARVFGMPQEHVRVIAPYVGGAFGSKLFVHPHVIVTALAARAAGRPVKFALTRQQMFALVGYRTPTIQRLRLGADQDGHLSAIAHDVIEQTATIKEFAEQTAIATRMLYAAPNRLTTHRLARLDVPVPTIMRAPGECPGMFALESAMDELAVACGIDPIELRIRNEPEHDPATGRPFSSRGLVACLREGARRFGWQRRDPHPRMRSDGRWLIGTGVAASTYPARRSASTAIARVDAQERYRLLIAASDIGTGAWTALTQIAADALEVPVELVRLEIGDTALPRARGAGGSMGTASWGTAIVNAGRKLCQVLRDEYGGVIPAEGLEAIGEAGDNPDAQRFSMHAFGAQFAEVRVNRDTGEVRVPRLLGVFAAGRIINAKTARSQLLGGMTMGLSMALHEESVLDPRFGDYVNHDFAAYHIATNADVGAVEIAWIEEDDPHVNPMGAKGIGEIGIVGTAAAIANAVYHATGVRVRDLPITLDKLLV
ncbi:MAG TPA: xanthine dehydrogenase family protein molybdopterin-binding subunit [Ktedonobacterales bacterium]|nr:xanthine dehydrogenase family protein molybdopterin-binding subunit [Ktedonobacterales bacterium]